MYHLFHNIICRPPQWSLETIPLNMLEGWASEEGSCLKMAGLDHQVSSQLKPKFQKVKTYQLMTIFVYILLTYTHVQYSTCLCRCIVQYSTCLCRCIMHSSTCLCRIVRALHVHENFLVQYSTCLFSKHFIRYAVSKKDDDARIKLSHVGKMLTWRGLVKQTLHCRVKD